MRTHARTLTVPQVAAEVTKSVGNVHTTPNYRVQIGQSRHLDSGSQGSSPRPASTPEEWPGVGRLPAGGITPSPVTRHCLGRRPGSVGSSPAAEVSTRPGLARRDRRRRGGGSGPGRGAGPGRARTAQVAPTAVQREPHVPRPERWLSAPGN